MKKALNVLMLLVFSVGCKENYEKERNNVTHIESTHSKIETTQKEKLQFEAFKNSIWVIGDVGLNGEHPDTIIFDKPDTLTYISDDYGKTNCEYFFSKGMLVYMSYSEEYDMKLNSEVSCKFINTLSFEKDAFRYVQIERKCSSDTSFEKVSLGGSNIVFRRAR